MRIMILLIILGFNACTTTRLITPDVDFRWRSTKAVVIEQSGEDFRIITDPSSEYETLRKLLEMKDFNW